jgi:CPA1 family monovalent cation:H+ antiporter
MLGTQLPAAMTYTWEDASFSNVMLVGLVLLLTFALMAVRFLWCLGMELAHIKRVKSERAKALRTDAQGPDEGAVKFSFANVRNALITTLCGAKGTITLSILFTIPVYINSGERFPERSLIIFLGCGVILCTLLLATFVVPLIAPKREKRASELEARQNFCDALGDILRSVIEELTAQQTKTNRRATRSVIQAYQNRLDAIKPEMEGADEDADEVEQTRIRLKILHWEEQCVLRQIAEGVTSKAIAYEYLARLERTESLILHSTGRFSLKRTLRALKVACSRAKMFVVKALPGAKLSEDSAELRKLRVECSRFVVANLKDEMAQGTISVEDASKFILDAERYISDTTSSIPTVTKSLLIMDESEDIRRLAYQIELEQIQKMYEEDRITRKDAKKMRENVFLMQLDLG